MDKDQMNEIICEQEESIAALEHKILDREDQRDGYKDQVLALKRALRRIECADNLQACHDIAGHALVELKV